MEKQVDLVELERLEKEATPGGAGWLNIGGVNGNGFGVGALEARVSDGDERWAWKRLTSHDEAFLCALRNSFPALRDELRAAQARVRELKDALRPFADLLKGHYSQQPDSAKLEAGLNANDLRFAIPLGAFRRARASLSKPGEAT